MTQSTCLEGNASSRVEGPEVRTQDHRLSTLRIASPALMFQARPTAACAGPGAQCEIWVPTGCELKGPCTGEEAPCRPRCLRPDKRRIWQEPRRRIKDAPIVGLAFALPPLLIQGLWGDVRRLQSCRAPELSG
ncbi:hypothetical protein SRHO_G00013070 [Serrasalmus rhombeus]